VSDRNLSVPGGRVPPHHSEAERSVLGAILLNNESIHRVLEIGLEARDFYREAHQKIFEVVLSLTERGEPVDLVTVTALLRDRAALEQVGGSATLTSLFDDTFAVGNVMHYARIVRDKAILRRMIDTTAGIAAEAFDGVENIEGFLDEAERQVFMVSDSSLSKSFSSMQEILVQNMHTIEELSAKRADVIGLATGFNDFDRLTGGLRPGQLVIIAARPAMGKTSLFLSMVQNIANSGKGVVAIFSLEMSKEELGFRFLSGMTRIEAKRLKIGRLADRDWPRLAQAADQLSKSKIFIDDSGDLTVMDIRSRCRRLLSTEKRLDMIVVDYLQLMKGSRASQKGDSSREREISEISRNLKNLAKEQKVPIIALSQLNRGVESRPNKRPMLSDLRECVTGDTTVFLADGRRVMVSELVGTTPQVMTMTAEGQLIQASADLVWCVGRKPVVAVTLERGRQIRGTLNHRLYAEDGWREVKTLQLGESLRVETNGQFNWEKIVGLTSAGEAEVYDLTVPETSAWIANGFVSHNSGAIEQDADMVCFIYRDEVYNKDSEDKGLAELIVAKHRAGETDTIRLAWLSEYTLFANLSKDSPGSPVVPMRIDKGDYPGL
jgi:replicative DNA helicase